MLIEKIVGSLKILTITNKAFRLYLVKNNISTHPAPLICICYKIINNKNMRL